MRSLQESSHHHATGTRVLKVDVSGLPVEWISAQEAVSYVAQDHVLWAHGQNVAVFHGGIQRTTGLQSVLAAPAIIAVKGTDKGRGWVKQEETQTFRRDSLFRRDRHLCAYCGEVFDESVLTVEHVMPKSRKGKNVWTNVVTACKACNQKKDCRTPEEAGMPLLYLPYAPNRFEFFILSKKAQHILGDQMDYLMAKVPPTSRLNA